MLIWSINSAASSVAICTVVDVHVLATVRVVGAVGVMMGAIKKERTNGM